MNSDALRRARRMSWAFTGILPLKKGSGTDAQSVCERRALTGIRLCNDVQWISEQRKSVNWFDRDGRERSYTPDANVKLVLGDAVLLEVKAPAAFTNRPELKAKYEQIGLSLRESGQYRFGLIEWLPDSVKARNIALLAHYWDVDPGNHALVAFDSIGQVLVTLHELLSHVERKYWPQVWAALAQQVLVVDLDQRLIDLTSPVSRPGVINAPLRLNDLVSTWWA